MVVVEVRVVGEMERMSGDGVNGDGSDRRVKVMVV